jgi:hypothetical protein
MTAPDRVISHARVMAAFADLNRLIEQRYGGLSGIRGISNV